jgi:aromatase
MAELRIRTARHTIRVAAPPKRVYQVLANVDLWPDLFDTLVAVEHLGLAGTGERVRFWRRHDGELRGWTSVRELTPKRLQVRFRREDPAAPLASLGGLWLVAPKRNDSILALDHYYRVLDDDADAAAVVADEIEENSTATLAALRQAVEFDCLATQWMSTSDTSEPATAKGVSTP